VLLDGFSRSNTPFVVERGSESIEVIGTPTEFAFDVRASRGGDTEPNRLIVVGEQAVAFAVVHHHQVHPVDIRVRPAPVVVFMIVVAAEFAECFINDQLAGVFHMVGVVNDGWFEVGPAPALPVKTVGFIADASGFNTPVL